ncbi:hypothetical protein [Erwinia sp. JH02]|uniref:hypothetical protein n=1 Tax=Erwinia sp. JH02 TaxID=2733394 RepID=UPI001488FB73|nr:hypothetical protein [Erwinia sp. JH02]NNS07309.1 hypothetical protein [Erwinia sp. JH02]
MAMNKKEQAAFDAAIAEAEVNRALRWSDYETERDVPKPGPSDGYVNGWSVNYHSERVYLSWSGSISHGDGRVVGGKRPPYGSQRGIEQYSTKEKALKAMRRQMEREFAQRLASVDRMIAAAVNEGEAS